MGDDDNEFRKFSLDGMTYQAIPDIDRDMANHALQEFDQHKFEQCLHTLKKLLSKRPQDSKVYHNVSVVDYYLSNFKKTDIFNKKMLETCKLAHIDLQDLESLDDVDNCIVLYNQAAVLYHQHQYHSGIVILDKVFQFIEPLEETLAKNICFLLLELYLCIYQPKKALYLVTYMETMLFSGNRNCGKQKEREGTKEENNDVSEVCKRRLQLCKARCYAMVKTSKACKREIKNLMSSGSLIQNIPAFYLKSQLEYLRGNYRKALKLLNSVTLPDDISKYFRETGDCLPAIFYNNVGCIHFYMGKPNLGHFYIQKALQAFQSELAAVTVNSLRPLHLNCVSTRHQLVYNLGLQFLQARKFEEAFSCFKEVVQSYHANPRLWLRIAECCIQIHAPLNTEQFVEYKTKSFVKAIVGAGSHRKLVLSASSEKALCEATSMDAPSLQFAVLCLKNSLFLLGEHSAGESVSPQSSTEEGEATSEDNSVLSVLPANGIAGFEVVSLRNSVLAAASYASLCLGDLIPAHEFARTLLQQPRLSAAHTFLAHLYAGESLLLMDRITEAVEHLNYRSSGDIELAFSANNSEVSLKHQTGFDSKLNEKNDDGSRPVGNVPNWFPDTISSAKFVTQYNLAVAYAVREEWSKAMECLSQMNPGDNVPSSALSLLIYVQTHQGLADDTKSYVKQYITSGCA